MGKDYCLSKAQALSVSAVFGVFGILDKMLIQLQKSLNTAAWNFMNIQTADFNLELITGICLKIRECEAGRHLILSQI